MPKVERLHNDVVDYEDIKKVQSQVDDIVWEIRKARKVRGWTQADLAKEIGVSQVTIARMEALSGNPTLKVLMESIVKLNLKLIASKNDQ